MPPAPAPSLGTNRPPLPHLGAVDGLRGLAIIALVLGHGGLHALRGGDTALSTLLVLIGFLLTTVLVAEDEHTPGEIDLDQFWWERLRRLGPGLLAAIGVAAVVAATGPADVLSRFRGDAVAAIGQLANWQFLAQGRTAAEAWTATPLSSPVLHLWSFSALAQLLVLLPVLVLVLVETSIQRRLAVAGWMVALAAMSGVAAVVVGDTPGAYFGTWTHAAAFLLGSALACALYDRRVTHALTTDTNLRFGLGLAGPLALATLVAAWITTQPTSPWLWRGGWAALGLVSCVVLLSALVPGGLLHFVLSFAPLQLAGRFSYGLFLFHWPAMVVLTEARVGVAGNVLLVVQLVATVVATAMSWWLLERPVLHDHRILGLPPLVFTVGLGVAVIVGVVAVTA